VITTPRDEAKAAGLRWSHVMQAARELRAAEIRTREPQDRARQVAWRIYCHWVGRTSGCHPFWRCGFDYVLGRLANSGYDFTKVKHYDLIAASVAEELPEWYDRCDELWEFLGTEYKRLPRTEEFISQAIEWLARMNDSRSKAIDEEF